MGGGTATLNVNTLGLTNYIIRNGSGTVFLASGSGGTTITVTNVAAITVRDENDTIVFTWP